MSKQKKNKQKNKIENNQTKKDLNWNEIAITSEKRRRKMSLFLNSTLYLTEAIKKKWLTDLPNAASSVSVNSKRQVRQISSHTAHSNMWPHTNIASLNTF